MILAPIAGLVAARGRRPRDRRRLALHPHGPARRRLGRPLGHRRPPLRARRAAGDPRLHAGGDRHRDPRDRRRRSAGASACWRPWTAIRPGGPLLAGLVAAGDRGRALQRLRPCAAAVRGVLRGKCGALPARRPPARPRRASRPASIPAAMRIALVSPYSWTYPGGVTRHIEALAEQLLAEGHHVRVLAPFDPPDRRSERLHRGARPQERPLPDYVIPLGRTVGHPGQRRRLEPRASRRPACRRCAASSRPATSTSSTSTSRSRPPASWDALALRRRRARRHLPHLRHERRHARRRPRDGRRPAHAQPARPHRRLRGRGLDRAALLRRPLRHRPQRRRRPRAARRRASRPSPAACGSRSSARPSSARACRSCCAPSRACASTSTPS